MKTNDLLTNDFLKLLLPQSRPFYRSASILIGAGRKVRARKGTLLLKEQMFVRA